MLDATRACELLVGLPEVNVLDVAEPLVGRIVVTVESRVVAPSCPECGERVWVKDWRSPRIWEASSMRRCDAREAQEV